MSLPPSHSQPAAAPVAEPPVVHRAELAISFILRGGVMASIALVIVGMGLTFVHHRALFTQPALLQTLVDPNQGFAFPHTLRDTWISLSEFRGQGFVTLGLLLLLLTPVVRVGVSILAFAIQRDWPFVCITTLVLIILILSFVLGKTEGG